MISTVEDVGERIRQRLLASGLLSAVGVAHHADGLVLTLFPFPYLHISPRIMRFLLNFCGEIQPRARRHGLFYRCAAFVEFPDDRCMVWISRQFYGGSAVAGMLAELLLLGLKLSSSFPSPPFSEGGKYRVEDLIQVYPSKEAALACYKRFAIRVLLADDDLFTEQCELALRSRWRCCAKHRYLFIQRLVIVKQIHHHFILRDDFDWQDDLPDTDYLEAPPPLEQMQQRLSSYLAQPFTPQEWLRARLIYQAHEERGGWDLPIRHLCRHKHHMSLACCQFRMAMSAIWTQFSAWLEQYNDHYRMSAYANERGRACDIHTADGYALLISLADLDIRDLPPSELLEAIQTVDTRRFNRIERADQ